MRKEELGSVMVLSRGFWIDPDGISRDSDDQYLMGNEDPGKTQF